MEPGVYTTAPAAVVAPRVASSTLKLIWTVIFGLMLAAWIIYLSGVAASQQACVDDLPKLARRLHEDGVATDNLPLLGGRRSLLAHGRELLSSRQDTCSTQLAFAWWTVWFDLLCIAVAVASAFMANAHQNVAIIFMTIETVILMVVANDLNSSIFANKDSQVHSIERIVAANRCAMAGNVILLILNFLYLIATTESTGAFMPALGGFAMPAMPKFGKPAGAAAVGKADADTQPPVTDAAGAAPAATPAWQPADGAQAYPAMPASYPATPAYASGAVPAVHGAEKDVDSPAVVAAEATPVKQVP